MLLRKLGHALAATAGKFALFSERRNLSLLLLLLTIILRQPSFQSLLPKKKMKAVNPPSFPQMET